MNEAPLPYPIWPAGASMLLNPRLLPCVCRFLLMRVAKRDPPRGIALSKVLLALAGLARAQRAYKLARFAYSRLQVGLSGGRAVCSFMHAASRRSCRLDETAGMRLQVK